MHQHQTTSWLDILPRIEALAELQVDVQLVSELQQSWQRLARATAVNFYTPSFKYFQTSEIAACTKNVWPAVSITGSACKLQCDHCKAKILEPMIAATTPEDLWRVVNEVIVQGARGMLLTGGSNHRNEVEYERFYPTIQRIKREFPSFKIAAHTALMDASAARAMDESGIDVAMMDVIGAQETITQVYHLKRSVDDFERTLENLVATRMRVVPHIVLGLHYGQFLGEKNALQIIKRHLPSAVVLVVAMPFYAEKKRPYKVSDSKLVGQFFQEARATLSCIPLLLGCARPTGHIKAQLDTYAVMAGLNGIAHPADGIVELATRLGRPVTVTPSCCSFAAGEVLIESVVRGIDYTTDSPLLATRAFSRLAEIDAVIW